MYALVLILNDVKKLHAVNEIFYEENCGATNINSRGLGKILLENNLDVPVFAGLRKLIEGDVPYNKTIISVINSEEKKNIVTRRIRKILDIDNKPGIGFMFVLPVIECFGAKTDYYK
ncbi:hypothetical protein [Clostridium botulinum]|uniref:Nitrogen regulatory protein P-II n=2 Tax=Clostridium botulinum TaxID=1491 RepID=C1FUV7_CLOBJ|nr:hypothetical protein [Clostridium botulinum]ACO85305.1 conserved hypothetical protein [Clostridium botulinum A2 str. Kyoto]APC79161.1 putative nitrogen regulatory protein P-II [Clostridium botulinum]APC84553.1 putative nitrogen regulatory protein P-II [Clostridium botulinum]APH22977.1 putative nitrogen regulatory protein P-II [Clostridium botulinum]APQ68154.1 putative nitrogen regulatory protein P-II [Clostridium botulinum]